LKEKIAIIGGGIAGLTAGYLLNDEYDITLFEKDSRLGGNAYSLETRNGEKIDIAVFGYSKISYPNFFKLLTKLNVQSSFFRLSGLFLTYKNFNTKKIFDISLITLNPKRLLTGAYHALTLLLNINRGAKLLNTGKLEGLTTQEAIALMPEINKKAYLQLVFTICLAASMHYDEVLKSPATFFFGKLKKTLSSIKNLTSMRCFTHGTESYIDALSNPFKDNIVLNSKINSVYRGEKKVVLKMDGGKEIVFDNVVFACNPDQALNLIENPTEEEERLLGIWKYKDGLVVVHTDDSMFSEKEFCNMYYYIYTDENEKIFTSINGLYKYQKGVPKKSRYIGTQFPNFPIKEELIEFKKYFRTPVFEPESFTAARELPSLNGKMNSYFCGSYFGFGLHEDAVTSAIEVVKRFGVQWN